MKNQLRWRSKIAWTTTLTLIFLILKEQFDIEITNYDTYITMLGNILVLLGVWNNPENKDGV